jgi:MoaA/NifB/PqqE/SkfB family radical SAM enzyme
MFVGETIGAFRKLEESQMQADSVTISPGLSRKQRAEAPLFLRSMRVIAKKPRRLVGLARYEYRTRLGIPRQRRIGKGRSALPVNLSINLTRRCNLRCSMCIQHRHSERNPSTLPWYDPVRELPLEPWVNLMDQVRSFGPTLYVTGGEPMLYPHFEGFIEEAGKRSLPIQLATNGTSMSKYAGVLVDRKVELVTVSLDGPPRIHDRIRGRQGLFRKAVDGVRALVEERRRVGSPTPIVGLNFTISRENLASIAAMVPIALDLEVDFIQFQHTIFDSTENVEKHNQRFGSNYAAKLGIDVLDPSILAGEYYESRLAPEEVHVIQESLALAERRANGRIRMMQLPNLRPDMIAPYYLELDHPFRGGCSGLWKTLRIMPDGTASPCLHVVAGNIVDKGLVELWNGPTMRNFRKLVARGLLPGCARCCSRSF